MALTNLPATYDLELFGPRRTAVAGHPSQDLPGVTDTLPSITPGATTESTPGSQDLAVTPPAGDQLEAVSNNPDAQSQYIQTPPLAAGTYIVQVSGYNGAYSPQPYLLQANLLGGATCPDVLARVQGLRTSLPDAAPGTSELPRHRSLPAANTLFLVNTQRLSAAFGSTGREPRYMADLESVASDSLQASPVPSSPSTPTRACRAPMRLERQPLLGRRRQRRRRRHRLGRRQHPGGEPVDPEPRHRRGGRPDPLRPPGGRGDASRTSATTAPPPSPARTTSRRDALSLGYYFSDDPYAASQPLGVGSATLYTRSWPSGGSSSPPRRSSLPSHVSYSYGRGSRTPPPASRPGYSFLTSGAEAV